jgi:hypothetical protein
MGMVMKKYGRATVAEILGDNIIYRNLAPVDPGIPGITDLWKQVGLQSSRVPRKTTPEYASVVACMLKYISDQVNPNSPIKRVVFIGDTRLNDGMAFQNICMAGDWDGMAFIAAEKDEPTRFEVDEKNPGTIVLANRWSALAEFIAYFQQKEFRIDDQTAVLLDLDKTTLGARGRNDKVIDQVRIQAANQTIRELLSGDFDDEVFSSAYQRLNQPEFHSFTADNQDYLVYICMILGSGITSLETLVEDINKERMANFDQFLSFSEDQKQDLPLNLQRVHDEVFSLVKDGDPTPFKDFRRQEFKGTVSHMGQMGDDTAVEDLLHSEITITQEVRQAAINWREQGALLFGLSDKPDEASIPNDELISMGYKPIHQVETHVLGA